MVRCRTSASCMLTHRRRLSCRFARESYAQHSSTAEIEARFLRRTVVYFIGIVDNDEHHPQLDTRCAAEMQGAERFERSRNYWNHLVSKFGRPTLVNQRRGCVPHGTHNSRTSGRPPARDLCCQRRLLPARPLPAIARKVPSLSLRRE
jgi:hypothetical protein